MNLSQHQLKSATADLFDTHSVIPTYGESRVLESEKLAEEASV